MPAQAKPPVPWIPVDLEGSFLGMEGRPGRDEAGDGQAGSDGDGYDDGGYDSLWLRNLIYCRKPRRSDHPLSRFSMACCTSTHSEAMLSTTYSTPVHPSMYIITASAYVRGPNNSLHDHIKEVNGIVSVILFSTSWASLHRHWPDHGSTVICIVGSTRVEHVLPLLHNSPQCKIKLLYHCTGINGMEECSGRPSGHISRGVEYCARAVFCQVSGGWLALCTTPSCA